VFATLAGAVFFFGVLTVVARETWRQTSPAKLESRGINADERDLPFYDPGLRKNYQPMLPFGIGIGIGRQTSAPRVRSRPDRAARQAGQAEPVDPVAMVAAAQARRGPGRQRSASLGPDATVNFGDERRASGIDEVMAALDTELIGLEPVKQKLAEIGSLLVDRARKRFGLEDRMDGFFDCNPGMNSRIAHHLDFAGYQTELLEIGQLMLGRSSYYLSAPAAEAFRNALERARLQHAHRLAAEPERLWSKDDLMRLEPADILGGTD
jgi:hypothetical protein